MRRMKDKIEGTITNADSALAVENLSASVDVASSGQSADITLSSLTKAKAKLSVAVTGVATMGKKGTTDLTIDVPNQNDLLNALTNDEIDAITGGMVDDDGNPIKPNEVIVDASLTVSGRAADAKVVGDALAGKADKSIVQDESGNVIFYSKAAVDELLAGKLGLHDTADNGVVASGSNYVRLGDGTQICWGLVQLNGVITDSKVRVTYPLAFSEIPRVFSTLNANVGVAIPIGIGWETNTSFSIGTSGPDSTGSTNWLAIGRWK